MRRVVVFPAPFGPRSPWIWPGRQTRSTPSTTRRPPRCLMRPRASSIGVTICIVPTRPDGPAGAGRGSGMETENPLRVPEVDLLQHGVGIALGLPVAEEALVAQHGVVRAEHDPVLEPTADLALQRVREVLRRPAGH